MCTVSMISDHYRDMWQGMGILQTTGVLQPNITREEFNEMVGISLDEVIKKNG